MSSKQATKKRGRINVVACNKCKRDKKKCDGSYLTQKPCKYCRDRNEYCEYTEPNRLRVNRIQTDEGDSEVVLVSSSNISDIINECENQHQNIPLNTESCKSDVFLQLLTDPTTTSEQTIILKRLYHQIMRNPEDPKFNGDKRDELCTKLKLLSSSNDNNHIKIQVWDDLCSLVNELDKMITGNRQENSSTILDSLFFNSWNSGTTGFSTSSTMHATDTDSTIPPRVEPQQSDLIVTNSSTVLNNQDETLPSVRKNQNLEVDKKTNSKKRKTRKNQRGNKRTQPYPAGGQIVIRPSKQAHTMIWHQNDPVDDVPIMAFHIQTPSIRPPAPKPPQRTRPQPSFPHYQPIPSIPIDIWDHSTTMTMLSPKPNFSESEFNETYPTTNLSPTPSLHDDVADIISSPSNSSIDQNMRMVSDDEKDNFGFISLTQSSGSPQSPSLFTMEDFIEMCSSNELPVEPIWRLS